VADALTIGTSLIGGGAFGAIITQLVAVHRNRKLPIGYRSASSKLFAPPFGGASPRFRVAFTPLTGTATELTNVHALRLELINRGIQDKPRMTFGVTLPEGQGIVHAEMLAGDRHHSLKIDGEIRPDFPSNEIDIILEPFNRRDSYILTLYVTIPENIEDVGPLSLSSTEAVQFERLPRPSERVINVLAAMVVSGFLPIRFSMFME